MAKEAGAVASADAIKKTSVSRSWILMDRNGKETILDADKYEIIHRVQLHTRDLRVLDPLLNYPSTIFGREDAIVLNLEHIKAVVTAEEILLRDPFEDNVIPVVEELRRRLPPLKHQRGEWKENLDDHHEGEAAEEDESPFEYRALEVALEAVCSFLDARTMELETDAYPALDELTTKISSRNLERMRKLKFTMTGLTARVQKVRDVLEQLLDDDGDMANLYISRKLTGAASPISGSSNLNSHPSSPTITSRISRASAATFHGKEKDVEELEMLLEAYFMQVDSTLNKLNTLREYIDDTEDYINIQLDANRNQLIQLEVILGSGNTCLSVYSLVTAIFGMNLPFSWNTGHEYVFKWVVGITALVCALIFILIIAYARFKGLVGS